MRTLLVDLAFPRTCAKCGLRGTWLCDRCRDQARVIGTDCCLRCGFPGVVSCRHCDEIGPLIERARAVYAYDGWPGEAVRLLKYAAEWERAESLAELMTPVAISMTPFDVIVPVPLHAHKEDIRGYNQSRKIAEYLGRQVGVDVSTDLIRTRETRSQVGLDREERLANMAGAFDLDSGWHPLPGLHVLLIDDVRTTGATLNACAEALQTISPASIQCLTFAIDMPRSEREAWISATYGRALLPAPVAEHHDRQRQRPRVR